MRFLSRPWVQALLIFLAGLLWFWWLQPWGGFGDPDGFYHAKMAELIFRQGPVMEFPWLDLTTLGTAFVNQNILYHYALIPFQSFFGTLPGTQIATVVFAALFFVVVYGVLRWMRVPYAWLWPFLLMAMPTLQTRLTWAKSGSLVQILFVIGMASMVRRRAWLASAVSALYALTHGGWILLLACQAAFVAGEMVVAKGGYGERAMPILKSGGWVWGASVLGILLGSLLHPNREALWHFFVTTVISIGFMTPARLIPMGGEWYAPDALDFFRFLLVPVAILVAIVIGRLATGVSLDRASAKAGVGYLLAFALPFMASLRSIRFFEYAAPLLIVALSCFAKGIDGRRLITMFRSLFPQRMCVAGLVILLMTGVGQAWATRSMIHGFTKPFGRFEPAMAVVRELAEPGERVVNSSWDMFPELFLADDRYRYVSGLDPTFLHDEHPEISKASIDVFYGQTSSSAHNLIVQMLGARVVIVDRNDFAFAHALATDERFALRYYDLVAAVYEVIH